MKISFLIILISISSFSHQKTVNQSFTLKILPDNAWVLKFEKNGTYEYYHWNGYGGTSTIEKGKYEYKKGLIRLHCDHCDPENIAPIPRQMYYTKMSKKEFEYLDIDFITRKEKKRLFGKQYLILSEHKIK